MRHVYSTLSLLSLNDESCVVRSARSLSHSRMRALQVILPLLIFTFGPISGAHFNPMVTSVFVATKQMVSALHQTCPEAFQCLSVRSTSGYQQTLVSCMHKLSHLGTTG